MQRGRYLDLELFLCFSSHQQPEYLLLWTSVCATEEKGKEEGKKESTGREITTMSEIRAFCLKVARRLQCCTDYFGSSYSIIKKERVETSEVHKEG